MAETVETRERLLEEVREAVTALADHVRSDYASQPDKWLYPTRVGEQAAKAALDHVTYSQVGAGVTFQGVAVLAAVERLLDHVARSWEEGR